MADVPPFPTPRFSSATVDNPPVNPTDAANKAYVDTHGGGGGGGAVSSVAGKTGDVLLIHTDITDWTAATSGFLTTSTSLVSAFNTRVGVVTLTGPDVTTALGYSPYDAANPAGYQTATQVASTLVNYVPLTQRGAVNGVASLDGTGVVPTTQLPGAVTGTLTYLGGWNAATNTPALASGALAGGVLQAAGRYYLVSVGATIAAIDGTTVVVAGDWMSSNGTVWQRVQNSTSPYLPLTGGTVSGSITVSTETWQDASEPDIAWSVRGTGGNIPLMLDYTGQLYVASLNAPAASITTLSGVSTLTGVGTLGATNATITSATITSANIANEQIADQAMPDLIGAVAGSNGNIVSGYDAQTGEFNTVSLNTGVLKIAGQPLVSATPVPSDALDVRGAPYNAVGDGQSGHGYVTTSGNTLTITNFTGTLTLAAIDANTSALTITGVRWSGWAFQPRHTGKLLYLTVGAYTLTGTVKLVQSGQVITLDNTGQTITPQTSVTGSITCPAVNTSMTVSQKVLIVEGMGQDWWWRQLPSVSHQPDTTTTYGVQTFIASVSSFPAPNQIVISGTFPFNWAGVATRILWGTNDSAAVIAAATAAWPLKRRLWFSGDGRLYLMPGAISDSSAHPSYIGQAAGNCGFLFNGLIWGGDSTTVYCTTVGAQRMPHRISPAWAPRYNDATKLCHGRQSFPRCAQIPASQPINVLIDGDSLGTMDPQSQVSMVMGAARFIAEFIKQNPGRQINFYNVAVGGATWASIASPFSAYNNASGNPYRYFVIPKPITGTAFHTDFWSNINRTSTSGTNPIIPDLVALFCCTGNDKMSYDGLAMQWIINQVRAVSHPDAYGPTDILMQADHHSLMAIVSGDGPAGGATPPGQGTAVLQEYYSNGMNRTAARNMGFPFLDYMPLQNRAAYGYDPTRRAMRQVPRATISPTPTAPVSLAEECLDYGFWLGMTGANDAACWTAVQQIELQLSVNAGNRLMLRMGPNGHIWAASSAYGLAVDTTVTIANGGTAITLGAAPSFTGNVTVFGGYPQATCTDGSVTFTLGMRNQCVCWRTGNYGGAPNGYEWQRNYVRTFLDANNVWLHEITHDSSDVALAASTFSIGGNQFIPKDNLGQPDVVIFYPDGTIFNTKVAYGSTITPTTATLANPAPQALTGATVSLFIGRMGMRWFDTGLIPNATTNTGIVGVNLSGGELQLGILDDVQGTSIPQWSVMRTVERFGGLFNPVVYVRAASTISLINRWVDDDTPIAASTPPWYQRGYIDQVSSYEQGGAGGHYGSVMRPAVLDTLYSHQNLTV